MRFAEPYPGLERPPRLLCSKSRDYLSAARYDGDRLGKALGY